MFEESSFKDVWMMRKLTCIECFDFF